MSISAQEAALTTRSHPGLSLCEGALSGYEGFGYAHGMEKEPEIVSRDIFVAYPWNLYPDRGSYKRVYTSLEKALSVKFVFAEERMSSGHVLDKIAGMIKETAFGIYDVSGWNPNVTLEYGLARGVGALAFIAFNPEKTDLKDVPTDVRGYDRLQYKDLDELSDAVATLVTQQLGKDPIPGDPLVEDQERLLELVRNNPGKTARQVAELFGGRLDYVQLLLRRSRSALRTSGATRGVRYYRKEAAKPSAPRGQATRKRPTAGREGNGKRSK